LAGGVLADEVKARGEVTEKTNAAIVDPFCSPTASVLCELRVGFRFGGKKTFPPSPAENSNPATELLFGKTPVVSADFVVRNDRQPSPDFFTTINWTEK
jgi:hypothetical protein